jgi:hypothetical protein
MIIGGVVGVWRWRYYWVPYRAWRLAAAKVEGRWGWTDEAKQIAAGALEVGFRVKHFRAWWAYERAPGLRKWRFLWWRVTAWTANGAAL